MINQYAITPDLPGGTRHFDFGCELVKRGYEVYIFASDINLALRKHMKLKPGELWREEEIQGVQFIWVHAALYEKNDWRRAWNMLSFSWNVKRVARQIKSKPDVIIGSSPHPFAAREAGRLASRYGSRFLLELRDLWPQALIDMGGMSERGLVASGLRLIENQLYHNPDKIVILASGSRGYLVKRSVSPDKIVYIPNGVHLSNFELDDTHGIGEDRNRWRERFGFNQFTIVYTGAHGPANSLHTIISAADILRRKGSNIQFALVGDGPTKKSLIAAVEERRLANVKFIDPIPKEMIPQLLIAADAAVITLRSVDAFSYAVSPNKLFDYMAAARPVICAVSGNVASLVEQNRTGLTVEPEDAVALAEAAERLRHMSDEERLAMGQRGCELVTREFSREVLVNRLVEIL